MCTKVLDKAILNYDQSKGVKFNTYLNAILDNERNTKWKNTKNEYSLNDTNYNEEYITSLPDDTNIEKEFERKELYAYIKNAINQLALDYQFVLNNYYGLNGQPLSVEKISDKIGCSVQMVYNMLKESEDFLRKKLNWDKYWV